MATIKELEKPGFYERINGYGEKIRSGLRKIAKDIGFDVQVLGVGSLFSVHFSERPLKNLRDILSSDRETAGAFYMGLAANGVYILEYHVGFTSAAHTEADIAKVLSVSEMVFREIKKHKS